MLLVFAVVHVNDLTNLELALANDEDRITIVAFVAEDLAALANPLCHAQVQRVQHCPRQHSQEGNLAKEFLQFVGLATVNVVEHVLIVLLAHHCEFAVSAAQHGGCSWLRSFYHRLVFLHSQLSEAFSLAKDKNGNHYLVVLSPQESLHLLNCVCNGLFSDPDCFGNVVLND